jgi:hypothetical protein
LARRRSALRLVLLYKFLLDLTDGMNWLVSFMPPGER